MYVNLTEKNKATCNQKDVKEYSFKVKFSIIVMHKNTDHINFIFSLNVGFRIRWFSIVGNINKPFLAFIAFV